MSIIELPDLQHVNIGETVLPLDVGATHSRSAFFVEGRLSQITRKITAPEGQDPTAVFYERLRQEARRACPRMVVISAAGPVKNGSVCFTNIDLVIDQATALAVAKEAYPMVEQVVIYNDALCGGVGVSLLPPELIERYNGPDRPLAAYDNRTTVLLGTGCGVFLSWGKFGQATELGHLWARRGNQPFVDAWMDSQYNGAVELEHYVSGIGLANIAEALLIRLPDEQASQLLEQAPVHDRARIIAHQATQGFDGNHILRLAFDYFRRHLGYLVSSLATLGAPVVLAGTPISANLDLLFDDPDHGAPSIKQAMMDRVTLQHAMEDAPVYGIRASGQPEYDELNLLGAGALGASLLKR